MGSIGFQMIIQHRLLEENTKLEGLVIVTVPAGFLFVHIYDVLHQQVPLQAIDPMSIQNHFMSTGWAAEPATRAQWRTSSCGQVGVWGLNTQVYIFKKCPCEEMVYIRSGLSGRMKSPITWPTSPITHTHTHICIIYNKLPSLGLQQYSCWF